MVYNTLMFNPSKKSKLVSSEIKVIVWDVDGTWYRPENDLIREEIKQRDVLIFQKLGISLEEAKKRELEVVKKTKSHTTAVSKLSGLSVLKVLEIVQGAIDRSRYLHKDEKLVKLFSDLSSFKHCVVTNMLLKSFEKTINLLGVNRNIFDFVVTPEETGVMKPDLRPFKMVLEKTGLRPEEHLFVGDRESVDIIPAKSLGMQTCYVWGKSDIADASIDEVYLLTDLLKRY